MKRSLGTARRLSFVLAALACSGPAGADAAPAEWRSRTYYAVNGALSAALLALGVLVLPGFGAPPAHATAALVAQACLVAGVEAIDPVVSDLEELRSRPYLSEYFTSTGS